MNSFRTSSLLGEKSFILPLTKTFYPTSRRWNINKTNYSWEAMRAEQSAFGTQTHVHEFEGCTQLAGENETRHNHRFAGVSSQLILMGNRHVHGLLVTTDFFDHHHAIVANTDFPVDVGGGKHVHFIQAVTTIAAGHFHELEFVTLIQSPLV